MFEQYSQRLHTGCYFLRSKKKKKGGGTNTQLERSTEIFVLLNFQSIETPFKTDITTSQCSYFFALTGHKNKKELVMRQSKIPVTF